ncbi:hypothetical protein C1H76_2963 [Elsinoe australis]|uniref:Uncharacterized protein n=1 Tax=Elsinoe australis TaxID=40998 RepID=A0A4U7B0W0_9PEZI|nr:hypothetical protein C1H76_2963 [Elsinoe australis]
MACAPRPDTRRHAATTILMILLVPLFLLPLPLAAAQTCRSFLPSSPNRYTLPGPTTRISPGAICALPTNPNGTCYIGTSTDASFLSQHTSLNITLAGPITSHYTLNITPPTREATQALYTLIGDTTGLIFWERLRTYARLPNALWLRAGQAGWAEYGLNLQCVNGTLEGCEGDSWVGNGTVVEACTVVGMEEGRGRLVFRDATVEEARRPWVPGDGDEGAGLGSAQWNEKSGGGMGGGGNGTGESGGVSEGGGVRSCIGSLGWAVVGVAIVLDLVV